MASEFGFDKRFRWLWGEIENSAEFGQNSPDDAGGGRGFDVVIS
jgi:hypothetical protein